MRIRKRNSKKCFFFLPNICYIHELKCWGEEKERHEEKERCEEKAVLMGTTLYHLLC